MFGVRSRDCLISIETFKTGNDAIAHIQDYVNRDDWLKHICHGVEVEELVEIVNSVCIRQ